MFPEEVRHVEDVRVEVDGISLDKELPNYPNPGHMRIDGCIFGVGRESGVGTGPRNVFARHLDPSFVGKLLREVFRPFPIRVRDKVRDRDRDGDGDGDGDRDRIRLGEVFRPFPIRAVR